MPRYLRFAYGSSSFSFLQSSLFSLVISPSFDSQMTSPPHIARPCSASLRRFASENAGDQCATPQDCPRSTGHGSQLGPLASSSRPEGCGLIHKTGWWHVNHYEIYIQIYWVPLDSTIGKSMIWYRRKNATGVLGSCEGEWLHFVGFIYCAKCCRARTPIEYLAVIFFHVERLHHMVNVWPQKKGRKLEKYIPRYSS